MKNILVVDDNAELRQLIKLSVGSKFHVIEAANTHEASLKIAEHRPELILLDIMMPGIDGLDWCHMIKKVAKIDYLKVIIISAKSGLEDLAKAAQVGADGYLAKPFSPSKLMSIVDDCLS